MNATNATNATCILIGTETVVHAIVSDRHLNSDHHQDSRKQHLFQVSFAFYSHNSSYLTRLCSKTCRNLMLTRPFPFKVGFIRAPNSGRQITSDRYVSVNANNSQFNDVGRDQYNITTYNNPIDQRGGSNNVVIVVNKRALYVAGALSALGFFIQFGMLLYVMCVYTYLASMFSIAILTISSESGFLKLSY